MIKGTLNLIKFVLVLILMVLVEGCTLPANEHIIEIPPEAVYTYAAQTIVAKYTQDASGVQVTQNEVGNTSTPTVNDLNQAENPINDEKPTHTIEITDTVVPSPTFTQTKTPVLTSTPETIWEDDFSNTFQWWVEDGEKFGAKYKDNGYIIYNNLLNAAIWSLGYLGLEDSRIEVEATRIDGPEDGYFGVFCRHANEGKDYYGLVIGDNGFYGIFIKENDEKEFLETGFDENEIIKHGKDQINLVRGECSGAQLILYANGEKLLEVTDETHTKGGAGLIVGNQLSGVGIEVLFHNFVIMLP